MVEVYITHGQINEHRYSVPSEKADEFISKQKKLAKKDLGIMLVTTAGLTALGTWGLNKLLKIKNKWIKYPLMTIGGIIALAASFGVSVDLIRPLVKKQDQKVLKKYDAERL
jgi:hypothetical protein